MAVPLKKTTTRISMTPPKQVNQVIQKAKSKPKVAIAVLALIPFLAMLVFTLKGRPSHVQSRQAAKINVIVPSQTPQELAEEATLALRKGDTMAFFDILDTKIKDPNIVNSHGDTLLLAAATLGNIEAVQRLVAMGADVNKQNAFSRDTAILRSVYGDHDDITQVLVYENADLNLPNNYRQTPMGLAVEKQKGQLVDLFLTKGVQAGLDSDTLFRAAAQKNYVGVMAMLKGNVDPNVKNSSGNTPLIISSSLGDTMSVQALLAYRADVNAANNDGNTALIYAARYNHPNTIMALTAPLTLQYKADLNMQNKRGETALYWAAMKGYAQVVKILLAYDADASLKTTAGQTALDVAKKYNREKVIELLQMPINDVKELFNKELQERQQAQPAAAEEEQI
ncbi:MAG: ankyrin repeat domain-containing protein [Elusimicrobiaceae bacterium]|nr:ankyrin repeat domain-containing protein [Elusimicrobiaceae bacterium]